MAEFAPNNGVPLFRYRDYLLSLARARVDARMWAQLDPSDIVQETLLKAHRAMDQFRGHTEAQLAAWLQAILSNTLANAVRALGRQKGGASFSLDAALAESSARLAAWLADDQLPPDQVAARNEQLLRLAGALAQLPEDQRTVVEMKHLHGFSVAEICERTGRTKASVVGLLFRGVKALRVLLSDAGEAGR
jgi:RNA polymerase sigma-70 factor (ECF subfamily)